MPRLESGERISKLTPLKPNPQFHFVDTWTVNSTVEEATDIFLNYADAQTWWPSCFLRTELLDSGGEDGIGRTVRAMTKGKFPYCLHVMIRVIEANPPDRYRLEFRGDLIGFTEVSILEDGDALQLVFDSLLEADKPIIKISPGLFHPVFAWNHYWVMKRGERSLQIEINRQKGSLSDRDPPSPPRPEFPHNIPAVVRSIRWKKSVESWES